MLVGSSCMSLSKCLVLVQLQGAWLDTREVSRLQPGWGGDIKMDKEARVTEHEYL